MFQTLTDNLTKIFEKIKGTGALTESHIDSAMRDIRIALLEADVALPVVRAFISEVSIKAKGVEVVKSVSPAQMVIKIINDEMIQLLQPDENESKINLQKRSKIFYSNCSFNCKPFCITYTDSTTKFSHSSS